MYFVIKCAVSAVASIIFTLLAQRFLPDILEPIFEMTGGDPDVLGTLVVIALVSVIALTWTWSARTHQPQPPLR